VKKSSSARLVSFLAAIALASSACVAIPDEAINVLPAAGQGGGGQNAGGLTGQGGMNTAGSAGTMPGGGVAGSTAQGGSAGMAEEGGSGGMPLMCPAAELKSPSVCIGNTQQALGTCKSITDFSSPSIFGFDQRDTGSLFWWDDGSGTVLSGLES
jgi:hypothetical protein